MRPNRLADEAYHRAEGYWLASRLGLLAVVVMVASMLGAGDYRSEAWKALATLTFTAAIGFLMERRWRARARWLHHTEQWWEKLNEAPSILPFPRTAAAVADRLQRWEKRANDSWLGRFVNRIARQPR